MEVFDAGFWQFIGAEILIFGAIFGVLFAQIRGLHNMMREHEKENATWREEIVQRMTHVEAKVNGKIRGIKRD